jgi:carbonic anhydrase
MHRPARLLALLAFAALAGCGHRTPEGVPPQDALRLLAAGNERYATAKLTHPDLTPDRRKAVATGQRPYAAVLGCADSRVPPELLFDQGLGQLFVVRVAGNVADDGALASLEYAAQHLGVRLIVVLGHERCGAVQAALSGKEPEGHLGTLVRPIQAAVARRPKVGDDAVESAMQANVQGVVDQLRASTPILGRLVKEGKLQVNGARYDLDTGRVTFFPQS